MSNEIDFGCDGCAVAVELALSKRSHEYALGQLVQVTDELTKREDEVAALKRQIRSFNDVIDHNPPTDADKNKSCLDCRWSRLTVVCDRPECESKDGDSWRADVCREDDGSDDVDGYCKPEGRFYETKDQARAALNGGAK